MDQNTSKEFGDTQILVQHLKDEIKNLKYRLAEEISLEDKDLEIIDAIKAELTEKEEDLLKYL